MPQTYLKWESVLSIQSARKIGKTITKNQKLRDTFRMEVNLLGFCTFRNPLLLNVAFSALTVFQPPVSVFGTTTACTQAFGGTAELESREGFLNLSESQTLQWQYIPKHGATGAVYLNEI